MLWIRMSPPVSESTRADDAKRTSKHDATDGEGRLGAAKIVSADTDAASQHENDQSPPKQPTITTLSGLREVML